MSERANEGTNERASTRMNDRTTKEKNRAIEETNKLSFEPGARFSKVPKYSVPFLAFFVSQFPLYLKKGEILSQQTSLSFCNLLS